MQTSELKKLYTVKSFTSTKECDGEPGTRWYVLPGEMSAIDAIKLVADKLHVSKDKVTETRGYVLDDKLYLRKSWEKVPTGASDVWAMTVRR